MDNILFMVMEQTDKKFQSLEIVNTKFLHESWTMKFFFNF